MHELMHVAMRIRGRPGYDWIVEGLAEYYSIELLRRGNAITRERAVTAMADQAAWGSDVDNICVEHSTGAVTARAVTIFDMLNRELTAAANGDGNLDDVLPLLAGQEVDLQLLRDAVEQIGGTSLDALHIDNLPGCNTLS